MKLINHSFKYFIILISVVSFSGCSFDDAVDMITNSKGTKRSVTFVIIEPFEIPAGDNWKVIGSGQFSPKTATLEATLVKGVKIAAVKRPWNPQFLRNRSIIQNLYVDFFESSDKRSYLKNCVVEIRKSIKTSETIIFTLIYTKKYEDVPSDLVNMYAYDVIEDKFVTLSKAIPKDSDNKLYYEEEVGALCSRICEKLYGSQ